ncbi:MAG TPA: MBL fold metallo-hydrolase [Ktedonobacterales bacterium]|nr:MBL fold metallo-hydrolase [Ktedonobacterales bacterium]
MTTSRTNLPASRHFTITRVGDGAWAAIAIQGAGAFGNAGIVDLGEETLIFDTMYTPQAARDLRIAAERLTGRRARYVVNSHYHVDHVLGNIVFDDATIIATAKTHDLIAEDSEGYLEYIRSLDEGEFQQRAEAAASASDPVLRQSMTDDLSADRELAASAHETHGRAPNLTFDRALAAHGTSRHVELFTWGGGHTASDAVLYLPHDRILFAGDLIFHRMHASMQYGDPVEWLRILDDMEKLSIDTLVPGHGDVTDHGAIAAQRAYLEVVLALGREAYDSGKSEDEAAETPIPAAYRDWGFASAFGPNMRAIYASVRDARAMGNGDQL